MSSMKKRILLFLFIILQISLFHHVSTVAKAPENYLKGKFYSSVKNNCLIATEKMRDNRFEKMSVDIDSMKYKHNLVKIPTIKIPKISESFSFLINSIITDVLIRNMQELTQDKNAELLYKNAITEPATIGAII